MEELTVASPAAGVLIVVTERDVLAPQVSRLVRVRVPVFATLAPLTHISQEVATDVVVLPVLLGDQALLARSVTILRHCFCYNIIAR